MDVANPDFADTSAGEIDLDPVTAGQGDGAVAAGDKLTVGQQIANFFSSPSARQREGRNRQLMLQRVHDFWVKGVLENSLHHGALIKLDMEIKYEDSDSSGERVSRPSAPPSRNIVDVYDKSEGILLILGEQGSGKTTMLLELARVLLQRAQQNPKYPIPVVLNLSSWSTSKKNPIEWLVGELSIMYQVPNKIARHWVAGEQLCLLLDGLDEIRAGRRASCVVAINSFRKDHGLTGVVVCSRTEEYERLKREQNVTFKQVKTIQLRPLRFEQIEERLQAASFQPDTIYPSLKKDKILQQLLQSPLMLNMILHAYRGRCIEGLLGFDKMATLRHRLIDETVKELFGRIVESRGRVYAKKQIAGWLSWLARKMQGHHQSVFFIESMQSSWLSRYLHQGLFAFGFRLLMLGTVASVMGIFIWPFFVLHFEHVIGFYRIIFWGGIMVSLWLLFYSLSDEIIPVEAIKWSGQTALDDLRLKFSLGFGLILTPICNFAYPASFVLFLWATWLAFFTLGGVSYAAVKLGPVSESPLGQSTRNCLRLWALFLIVYGGIMGLLFASLGITVTSLSAAIATWLIIGLIGSLKYGGLAVLQHYILRLLLYLENHTPPGYVHFLDYATEGIFLRKVGRGYIFTHRDLMEYLAALTPEEIERLASDGARTGQER